MSYPWVKIWRKMQDSFIGDYVALAVFIDLLLRAEDGVVFTTRRMAAAQLGMSEGMWYRAIHRLEVEQRIEQQSNSQGTTIYICKWHEYQQQSNSKRTTIEQQTNSHPPTPPSKDIYINNLERRKIHTSDCLDFITHFNAVVGTRYNLTPEREKLILKRLKDHSLEELKAAADNFSKDEWPDRYKYRDIQYCIGTIGGKDNLDKWMNLGVKPKKLVEIKDERGRVIDVIER